MRPVTIVLVEDNAADVLLVRKALTEAGIEYSLTCFESGIEAVGPLCRIDPKLVPDVILMDLNTPRSDGFEILKILRSAPHLATVPIAILTSSKTVADRNRAALHGARFIEKPSRLDDFLSSVGKAVTEMLAMTQEDRLENSPR